MKKDEIKRLVWLDSADKDLKAMPSDVQDHFGYALHLVQTGRKADDAKPLKGFGAADVLEIVDRDRHGAFRAVYTVRFENAVYVLHCFQKKSTYGIATPKPEMNVIHARLKAALAHAKGDLK